MKNKSLFKFLILLSIFIIVFAFSGCSLSDFIALEEAPEYIVGTTINENGELIIEYSNGNFENLGVVVGSDGKDGVDGTDGKDGVDGADGKDGAIIQGDGNIINFSHTVASVLQSTVIIQCKYTNSETNETAYSSGAGVFYSCNKSTGDALIVTNYHVLYNSKSNTENKISNEINVFLYGAVSNETAIEASFVGGSMQYDLAVLKVSGSDLIKNSEASAVNIKNSNLVHAGDAAFAIGNPKADGFSVTSGIVSVDSETIEVSLSNDLEKTTMRVMRIDVPVNAGNSGGGLFDSSGQLIGIVNAKSVESEVDNIGYAIPSSTMVSVVENIIDNCLDSSCETARKLSIGITVQIQNPYSKYNSETGYVDLFEESVVIDVKAGSLADGNFVIGDKIKSISISGSCNITVPITRQYQLLDAILYARAGDIVTITVDRFGDTIELGLLITDEFIFDC